MPWICRICSCDESGRSVYCKAIKIYTTYLIDGRKVCGEERIDDDLVAWLSCWRDLDRHPGILEESDIDGRDRCALWRGGERVKGVSAILSKMMLEDGQDRVHFARWILRVLLYGVWRDILLTGMETWMEQCLAHPEIKELYGTEEGLVTEILDEDK
jgi:hypothetical protein